MEIRKFEKSDTEQVAKLIQDSVKILNPQESSEQQSQSQTSSNIPFRDWEESFLQTFTIIAEQNHRVVGIAQLDDTGHINWFYCHPDFRRQGIGGQLYAAIEDYAYSKNIPTLFTETHPTDSPFFFKMGFQKVQKQKSLIRGEIISSFILQKVIYTGNK